MADLEQLLAQARDGRPRALGRLISAVENGSADLPRIIAELAPQAGSAYVIGLTGPPGVGKSTLVAALIGRFRAQGLRVGVLAVDPSSPFSGGAVLGDRIRMQEYALDPGVYVRSMATRGHLGGLAAATSLALRVYAAAGFDVVLLETVGVGQSEVEVAGVADLALVLAAPGAGDGVQAAKAGLLEIGDIFVVNKADRDGAHALVRELRGMLALAERAADAWRPRIVTTTAVDGGGVDDLLVAVEAFRMHQAATGADAARRISRSRREIETLVQDRLLELIRTGDGQQLRALAAAVSRGEVDPFSAADSYLSRLLGAAEKVSPSGVAAGAGLVSRVER